MSRRSKLLMVIVIVLPVLAYIGWVGYVQLIGPAVQSNTFVDQTEPQLRASFGKADEDWQGYQSLALYVLPSLPPGSIRTLIFHPHGLLHPEGGTLWVWVVEQDGVWVCFESCWFANGVVF